MKISHVWMRGNLMENGIDLISQLLESQRNGKDSQMMFSIIKEKEKVGNL